MTTPSRKATIFDIAKLAETSPSTVSAALSGSWKERRISESKVELIRRIAEERGYSINMQARGLRQARSGMVGMVIPVHDNRYFSSMSQSFEYFARERGLVPVIASSMRDAQEERRIVQTLISYAVEYIFIAGATDPVAITALCAAANMRHIFVDLPGPGAPSVISDNYLGARMLTKALLDGMTCRGDRQRDRLYFIGGCASDHATSRRIEGFRDVLTEAGLPPSPDQIIACGYPPRRAMQEIASLHHRLGALPAGLFVNSLTAFEGVLGHFVTLPPGSFDATVIGCYDYDPFAAYLHFPVHMVRQDSHGLIEEAYRLIDEPHSENVVREVEATLLPPRTIWAGPFGEHG
jgi:LacI family fructose operon transcriptional repressor